MKRDKIIEGDLTLFKQRFDNASERKIICSTIKKYCKDTEIHVRRNTIVAKTNFSSNAWLLTFIVLCVGFRGNGLPVIELVSALANTCMNYAKRRKTWFLSYEGRRVPCIEFLEQFQTLLS